MNSSRHKIQARTTPHLGRGFFALESIQPRELLMTLEHGELIRCNNLAYYYELQDLQVTKVLFAYFIAAASAVTDSVDEEVQRIQNYTAQLPEKLHGLLMWSQEELAQIQNKELVAGVTLKKAQIELQFSNIHQHVTDKSGQEQRGFGQYRLFKSKEEAELVDFQKVLYFYCVLQSRSVYDSEYNDVGALAPDLEIFNHSSTKYCNVEIDQRVKVTALDHIQQGEQVFVCYGRYSAEVFMERYGFLPNLKEPIPCDGSYRRNLARQYNLIYQQSKAKFT